MPCDNRLAIVIPAYKGRHLKAALDSLVRQTDAGFRVYVADDASPDAIGAIVGAYRDRLDIIYRRFEANLGSTALVRHWDRAIRLGDEPWVWLFSDDDLAGEECVAGWRREQAMDDAVALWRFDLETIDEGGRMLRQEARFPDRLDAGAYARWVIAQQDTSCVIQNVIFHRTVYEAEGGFVDLPGGYCSDLISWPRFARHGGVRRVTAGKVQFRVHAEALGAIMGRHWGCEGAAIRCFAATLRAYRELLGPEVAADLAWRRAERAWWGKKFRFAGVLGEKLRATVAQEARDLWPLEPWAWRLIFWKNYSVVVLRSWRFVAPLLTWRRSWAKPGGEKRPDRLTARGAGISRLQWIVLLLVGVLVLGRVAAELTGRGSAYWHWDLRTLASDQSLFYARIYPHFAVTPTLVGMPAAQTAYPPFAFPLFMPWLPPGLGSMATRAWFTFCQLSALGLILRFVWRQGRRAGLGLSCLLAGSVLAMSGVRADLLFGNMALIATALVVVMHDAAERGRWGGAAGVWVMSLVKPQIGWLFGWELLRARRWRATIGAAVALAGATAVGCIWTHATPWRILRSNWSGDLSGWTSTMQLNNLPTLASGLGLPAGAGLVIFALAGVIVAATWLRGPPAGTGMLPRFAVLGLLNRICTYHNYCDDVLLVFALAWLGRRAWCGGTRADWGMFFALATSVWVPVTLLSSVAARSVVLLSWICAAAWIVRQETKTLALAGEPTAAIP